jgi:1-acyl-sn-glycerol-3-phosphate acyltransferase
MKAPGQRISPVKLVLGRVYCTWAALLFIATMLVALVPIWLALKLAQEPRRSILVHRVYKVWMSIFLPLIFCPVRRRGQQHFASGQNYVVVCNHNSFMDVPVTSPYIPGANKTLAKIEIARVPLFGIIYTAGAVLVDRKSERSRHDSFSRMEQALAQGLHLCLYPEGTRNKGGALLQPFHKGAFVTAIKMQKPIMPAVLSNTARILPSKPVFWAWPRTIEFQFLPPVSTVGLTQGDVGELKERVHKMMLEAIEELRD